jgi:putative membrane protein insertion efficiency factor
MSAQSVLVGLLAGYKRWISPLLPPACRFHPSCSEYAREAIERHGAGPGLLLALRRLLRCQPFCVGGFDPVPEPRNARHGNLRPGRA